MLKDKLDLPNYAKILSPDSASDVGALALDTQTIINSFCDWAVLHDAAYVFGVLCIMDFSDIRSVTTMTSFTSLLIDYMQLSLEQVTSF